MLITYYNELLGEVGGFASLLQWTGEENPSSVTLEESGIFPIEIADEKAGLPFEPTKVENRYIAVYPEPVATNRFGYLSGSDRGKPILINQSDTPGQIIHVTKTTERINIFAINNLDSDVSLVINWGDGGEGNYLLRAFTSSFAIPAFCLGEGITISAWADTLGILIAGGWES